MPSSRTIATLVRNRTLESTKYLHVIYPVGQAIVYDRNHYFSLDPIPKPKPKPNWVILSADTVTDTETPFQRENLVTNIVIWGIL